jgi:hypothetical protein
MSWVKRRNGSGAALYTGSVRPRDREVRAQAVLDFPTTIQVITLYFIYNLKRRVIVM